MGGSTCRFVRAKELGRFESLALSCGSEQTSQALTAWHRSLSQNPYQEEAQAAAARKLEGREHLHGTSVRLMGRDMHDAEVRLQDTPALARWAASRAAGSCL